MTADTMRVDVFAYGLGDKVVTSTPAELDSVSDLLPLFRIGFMFCVCMIGGAGHGRCYDCLLHS